MSKEKFHIKVRINTVFTDMIADIYPCIARRILKSNLNGWDAEKVNKHLNEYFNAHPQRLKCQYLRNKTFKGGGQFVPTL